MTGRHDVRHSTAPSVPTPVLAIFLPSRARRTNSPDWSGAEYLIHVCQSVSPGSAAGPIVGGLIVDAGAWRAIFALPALLSIVAWCLRPREGDPPAHSHCAHRSRRDGLLPIALLKDRAFMASNLASGSVYFAVYGLSFALATSLPESLSSSSLRTGLHMAPAAVMMLDALMMERPSPEDSNAASAFGHIAARVAGFAAIALGGMMTASASLALVAAAVTRDLTKDRARPARVLGTQWPPRRRSHRISCSTRRLRV